MIDSDDLQEAFSDGNMDRGEFGIPGIIQSLKTSRTLPLDEALTALFDDSHVFTNGISRHHDTSGVLIKRS